MTVLLVLFVAVALSVFLYHQHKGLLSESGVAEKGQELAAKLLPDNAEQQPSEESQNSAPLPVEQGKTGLNISQKGKERSPEITEEVRQKKEEQKDDGSLLPLASLSFPSSLEEKEEPGGEKSLSPANSPEGMLLENIPPTPSVLTLKEEVRAHTPPAPPLPPFAGRSLEEITREEISAILQKRREAERRLNAARRGGWQ
jgi:hypothetical protein